jgi:hypothetical protein
MNERKMEKKMIKKLVAMMVFGALGIGIAATSQAAGGTTIGTSPTPTVSPSPTILISVNPCPTGWQLMKGTKSGDNYTCQPTKTKVMVQCPPGLEYYDNGCGVGCNVPPK